MARVKLAKSKADAPVTVRNGPFVYTVEPGGDEVEVPARLAGLFEARGATVSYDDGEDEPARVAVETAEDPTEAKASPDKGDK